MSNQKEQEVWKQIPSFPLYEASNFGRIRHKRKQKLLAQSEIDFRGYRRVMLYKDGKSHTKKVARMVWSAFNDCECGETIDHIDRNPTNNYIGNLRCVSIAENNEGRTIYRKYINKYNLNDDKRLEILTKWKEGTSIRKLSFEYRIPHNYLHAIFKRGNWEKLWIIKNTENTENSSGN